MQNMLSFRERWLADNEVELSAFVTVAATVSNEGWRRALLEAKENRKICNYIRSVRLSKATGGGLK